MRRAGRFSRRSHTLGGTPAAIPAPTLSSLSSSSAERFTGAKTLTLTGTGFAAGAAARINGGTTINGGTVTTVFVNTTTLTVTVPSAALWEVASLSITVQNPDTQISNSQPYAITQHTLLQAERRADVVTLGAGSNVQAFPDQSGLGDAPRAWTQLVGTRQGLLNATDAAFNNQATVTMGSDDFYESGAWSSTLTQPCTVVVVAKVGSTVDHRFIWDQAAPSTADRMFLYAQLTSGFVQAGANATVLSANTNIANLKMVCVAVYNTASSAVYINSKTALVSGAVGVTAGIAADRMGMNNAGATANPLLGTFAHQLAFEGALSAAHRNDVIDYLAWRYGVTLT